MHAHAAGTDPLAAAAAAAAAQPRAYSRGARGVWKRSKGGVCVGATPLAAAAAPPIAAPVL